MSFVKALSNADLSDEETIKAVSFSPAAAVSAAVSGEQDEFDPSSSSRPNFDSSPSRMDITTGCQATTTRGKLITEVDADEQEARSRWAKALWFWNSRKDLAAAANMNHGDNDDSMSHNAPVPPGRIAPKQFRIRSRSSQGVASLWKTQTAESISSYLTWTYRASFCEVIIASYALFMVLIIIFALLIYGAAVHQPECTFALSTTSLKRNFMDVFQLSWTTLSTVGFGIVGPQTGTGKHKCIGINSLMAFEAFVGILFGGVAAAVMIGKIARIQSIAQVRFSHPICVRYGIGAMDREENVESEDDIAGGESPGLPCPVLEFRIINELSGEKGGEIMNASVTVVASILDNDDESTKYRNSLELRTETSKTTIVGKAAKTTTDAARKVGTVGTKAVTVGTKAVSAGTKAAMNTGAALFGAGKRATHTTGTFIQQLNRQLKGTSKDFDTGEEEGDPYNEQELADELAKAFEEQLLKKLEKQRAAMGGVCLLEAERTCVAVDEGNAQLAPPRTYHKLEIETDKHPYFKRVWNIRHVLDENSPLLSAKARRMIEENNGCWPERLNDHSAVREHLHFNDCIVSFSGTANVSGSSVYAQKVYDFVDVIIGYTFANVLAIEKGLVVVDAELLNDVKEQIGGGAEPIRNLASEDRDLVAEAATTLMDGAKSAFEATKSATEGAAVTAKTVHGVATDTVFKTCEALRSGAVGTTVATYGVAVDAVSKSTEVLRTELQKIPQLPRQRQGGEHIDRSSGTPTGDGTVVEISETTGADMISI